MQPLQLLSTLSQVSGETEPLMMLESACESWTSLVANLLVPVPPAAAMASVLATLPPAKLMTCTLILKVFPPTTTPFWKRSVAAFTASCWLSQVSSPSVRRMTLTERQARSFALSGVG